MIDKISYFKTEKRKVKTSLHNNSIAKGRKPPIQSSCLEFGTALPRLALHCIASSLKMYPLFIY